jgi:hypothetical protein
LKTLLATVAILTTTLAHAENYTYMCRVDHRSYLVKLYTGKLDDCGDPKSACTITWRGTTFTHVKPAEDCGRAGFTATKDGVTITLCTATQGVADLQIGNKKFECQMPKVNR